MQEYVITSVEGNQIYIKHNLRDALGGFIILIKSIEGELGGRIVQLDGNDIQYEIQNDPFNLIFKWDADLGMVVIVPNLDNMDAVLEMLNGHLQKLND